jgi:hypothetical protein
MGKVYQLMMDSKHSKKVMGNNVQRRKSAHSFGLKFLSARLQSQFLFTVFIFFLGLVILLSQTKLVLLKIKQDSLCKR